MTTEPPKFYPTCDFCGSTGQVMEFAVDEADVPVEVTSLDGRILRAVLPVPGIWRACSTCALLVHAGDRVGLLDRGHHLAFGHVSALVALTPGRRRQFLREHRRGLVRLHAKFWAGYSDEGESAA